MSLPRTIFRSLWGICATCENHYARYLARACAQRALALQAEESCLEKLRRKHFLSDHG
jgi:hypothetical protein